MNSIWKTSYTLAVLALSMVLPLTATAQTDQLWGVSLNGFNSGTPGSSSLYAIDPVTGAGTLVGTDLGHAVNAIAIHPITGKMYASTTSWSGAFNGLLEVDPSTGTAIEIGEFGDSYWAVLALTFDSSGQLWGWHDPSADDPVKIDTSTGVATTVGDAGVGTGGHVMAFDASDTLFMIQGSSVYTIDQATGAANSHSTLSFDPGSGGADFDPTSGLLWASATKGNVMDASIRMTDIAGDSFTDLDTDVEYLNAVTFGGFFIAEPPTVPVPVMSMWFIALLVMLIGGGAFVVLRRRHF